MIERLLRPPPERRDPRERFVRRAPLLLILIVASAMVALGWEHGPDPVVDFGREAYVPWRLAYSADAGPRELLYRDILYLNGPLSPYVNAAAFKLFGTCLRTLKTANVVVLALVTLLTYQLALAMSDRLTACAAAVVFLVIFAASQYVFTN